MISTAASPCSLTIDVDVRSPRWDAAVAGVVKDALSAAASVAPNGDGPADVSVVLTDDREVQALNAKWRGKDTPTNVLSFPLPVIAPTQSRSLGDIVIAYETTRREATLEGKPLTVHLAHLVVHGYLHLLGHDHDDDAPAEAMESLERAILARLAIPDPYADRAEAHRADANV